MTLAFLLNLAALLHRFAAGDEPQICVSGTDGSDCTSAVPEPESDAGCQETLGTEGSSCNDYIRAGTSSCAELIGYGYDCSCTCSTGTSSEDSVPAAGGRGDTKVDEPDIHRTDPSSRSTVVDSDCRVEGAGPSPSFHRPRTLAQGLSANAVCEGLHADRWPRCTLRPEPSKS